MKKVVMICLMAMMSISFLTQNVHANAEVPEITTEAAILMDTQTGAVLFRKNEETKMFPASLTKIATAIYAIEKANLNEQVTVREEATKTEGTKVYLNPGEQVSLKKLIQGMIVNSGNDAASAIALYLDGSYEEYEHQVNDFLETEVGVSQTHFTNPHGLYDEDHYTTAKDMGIILNYAMKNKDFREIFATKELAWQGQSWETTIFSHHRMLKGEIPYPGVTGGKTGFVDQSKQTLATTADNGQIQLTTILLKSETKRKIYQDTISLMDYGFINFKTSLIKKNELFKKGDKKFITSSDSYLTEPIGQEKRRIDETGLLSVEDQDGKTIQFIELEAVEKKKSAVNKTTRVPEQSGVFPVNQAVGGTIVMAAIGGWLLNKRQKRERRYRSRSR